MTVQEFIYINAKLENENTLEEKECICGLCNTQTKESISNKKIFSGNFTNDEYFSR